MHRDACASAIRVVTVESKTVAMALEKAVQEARGAGWETMGVRSCNPLTERPRLGYGWAGQVA